MGFMLLKLTEMGMLFIFWLMTTFCADRVSPFSHNPVKCVTCGPASLKKPGSKSGETRPKEWNKPALKNCFKPSYPCPSRNSTSTKEWTPLPDKLWPKFSKNTTLRIKDIYSPPRKPLNTTLDCQGTDTFTCSVPSCSKTKNYSTSAILAEKLPLEACTPKFPEKSPRLSTNRILWKWLLETLSSMRTSSWNKLAKSWSSIINLATNCLLSASKQTTQKNFL